MLTDQEMATMATAVLLAQRGAGFVAGPEDAPTCEALVKRDYLEPVEGEERGFVLTKRFATAVGVSIAKKAARRR